MKFIKFLGAAMAAVSLGLAACSSTTDDASRRSAGEFSGDAAVNAKVKTAIAQDAGVGSAAAINVNTYRGVVQLSGFVDSAEKIQAAEKAARSVEGVRSVENGIKVKPAS